MMLKISVIIPVYNMEKYLHICMDSVINQTYKNLEIICINDGSTDKSLDILNEYAKKDSRIQVYTKENGGLSSARNEGLKYITGDLCHFLDGDDYIEQNLYEYTITIFENFDIDYFCFSSTPFIDGENILQNFNDVKNYIFTKRDGFFNLNFDICFNTNIHVWNKIFKTKKIKDENIRFLNGYLYEDIYFVWLYNFLSNTAYFEQEVFHHYRLRSDSIMGDTYKNKTYEKSIYHMLNWYELYKTFKSKPDLFITKYNDLLSLLNMYKDITKNNVPVSDKYKIEIINQKYYKEISSEYDRIMLMKEKEKQEEIDKPIEKIFSIKNSREKKHKIITILGIKFKFKQNKNNIQN